MYSSHVMRLLATVPIMVGLIACGDEGPTAIHANTIKHKLQEHYSLEGVAYINVEALDILAIEQQGTQTEPLYSVRLNINSSLPDYLYYFAYSFRTKSVYKKVDSKKALARLKVSNPLEDQETVLSVRQLQNGEWVYGFNQAGLSHLNIDPYNQRSLGVRPLAAVQNDPRIKDEIIITCTSEEADLWDEAQQAKSEIQMAHYLSDLTNVRRCED